MRATGTNATSIRRRLLLGLFAPAAAVLVAATVSDYLTVLAPLTDAYDQALLDSALVIAAHVRPTAAGLKLGLPPDALDVLRADSTDSIFFRVSTADGTFVAGDADLPSLDTAYSNPAQRDSMYRGAPVRLVAYTTFAHQVPLTVTMGETTHKRVRTRNRILTTVVATDLIILSVILTLILVGVKVSLKPLRDVEDQIASRSARDLTPLSSRDVPAEIERLVLALNRLFTRVSEDAERQRQFLDNAAHQLRTPIAGIQAQLENLCAEESNRDRRERLERVLDGARRVGQTAHQLLTLARADESALPELRFETVDLAAFVEAAVADNLAAAERARIDLGAAVASATVAGIGWLLAEALGSLVSNAIAHTPAGGSVTLGCGVRDGKAYLEVTDTGIGIPEAERERVLERFYRASNARGEGSGLGLAIAKEVADLHGGVLEIAAGPEGRGTVVRLLLPRTRTTRGADAKAAATAVSY